MSTHLPHSSINLSIHNVVSCEVSRRIIPCTDSSNRFDPTFEAFDIVIRDAHGIIHRVNVFGLANVETRERCTPIILTVKEEPIPV